MQHIAPILKNVIQRVYKPGKFYRIPLGPLQGKWIEYQNGIMTRMLFGIYESAVVEVFRQLIRPGMMVLDIGANIGYFSLYLNELVGSTGKIMAFEPIPAVFQSLERVMRKNKATQVQCLPYAIMETSGREKIFLGASSYQASLDSSVAGVENGAIEVEGKTIDAIAATLPHPVDFIKMDIEGGALYALKGAESTIRQQTPIMLLECHSSDEERMIGEALTWGNYVVFRVGEPLPVKNLQGDHHDPYGIYGCVLAIPYDRLNRYPAFDPSRIQRKHRFL